MLQGSRPQLSSSLPPSLAPSPSAKLPIPAPRPRPKLPTPTSDRSRVSPPLPSRSPSPHPSPPSRPSPRNSEEEEEEEEEGEGQPMSLGEFVLECSTLLPLQMKVQKGHHGGDEKHSIATGDVYDVHFVKRTKVVVLRDRRGATFNIPLNSAVQFAPVFSPGNDPREPAKGAVFERVADVIALKSLPRVIRATKPHVRMDPKSTIEKFEVFVVQGVVSLSVRKKVLKVFSITCNQNKLLLPDSVGAFSTESSLTYLYLLEIIEHFLTDLPIEVKVVMSDCDMSSELPFYLTNEVATLLHLDSETSLIASTSWGQNEVVSEEDQLPVEIPLDLPIEVVVQAPDGVREAHLSDHTKRLYERFDPSRIRLLRTRNIRRGFEKEGMELQRPERIYEVPDACLKRNTSPQRHQATKTTPTSSSSNHQSVSSQLRPRLATPTSTPDPTYSQAYQPLGLHTKVVGAVSKPEYTAPEPQRDHSPPSPGRTSSERHTLRAGKSPRADRRDRSQFPLPPSSGEGGNGGGTREREAELLENRVEILEREVHALRAEIGKLKTLGQHLMLWFRS